MMSNHDKINDAARRDFVRRRERSPPPDKDPAEEMEKHFKGAFLIDREDPLHPPSFSTTQPISLPVKIGLMAKVKSFDIDCDDIRMADAPHTCARCALKFVHHDYAFLPCI